MDLTALQRIAFDVAQALSIEDVLTKLVGGLAEEPGVALARIWLVGEGDLCEGCNMRPECPDQSACLHLEASAGRSRDEPHVEWKGTGGGYRRMPLGVRKVGRIGSSGRAELLHIGPGVNDWLRDPSWAESEGICTFAGQPLVFRGEVVGVLGLFCRRLLSDEEFGWLRTFADQAAVALGNARAFEEVHELRRQLELECGYLREEIKVVQSFGGIIGKSPAIQKVLHQIEVVAPTEATVLIEGESGTGKELIAVGIHENSLRKERALVRVNCASIPKELFESEFFGHVKGAFTGAIHDRAGRFQVADGGTLFLDEVGEIPLDLQGKLLRVLQEGRFSRVGEDRERAVNVRVVAATNRELRQEVAAGNFREDLYYRLTVFPLQVPPLRERLEDVPLLAARFLDLANKKRPDSARPELRKADLAKLSAYAWPGNVRELQNVIERAVILSSGKRLMLEPGHYAGARPAPSRTKESEPTQILTDAEMQDRVRANTLAALEECNWKISGADGASELLGINPNTLASRMKTLGLRRPAG